jgi:hypothetical protein
MRQMIIPIVLSSCMQTVAPAQTGSGATPIKPCSLLTPELVQKVSAGSTQRTDAAGAKEVSLGASGSACDWGALILQVDPFPPARLEEIRKTSGKDWEVVPGVGDAAYFHNIRDVTAELFVRVGARTFGVLIDIPKGSTAAAFKPNFVMVANAIVPKLR